MSSPCKRAARHCSTRSVGSTRGSWRPELRLTLTAIPTVELATALGVFEPRSCTDELQPTRTLAMRVLQVGDVLCVACGCLTGSGRMQ
eukprot:500067-Amphidinium_carterae.1